MSETDQVPPPPPAAATPEPVVLREPEAPNTPPTDRTGEAAAAEDAEVGASGWEGIFEPGEVQLWQGQPVPGIDWQSLTSDSIRSGLIPLIGGVLWLALVLTVVEPILIKLFMAFFGLPFLWTGYNLTLGKPLRQAREAATTWYTLSNRALYIAKASGGQRELDRFPLDRLAFEPRLVDGSPGHIWFAEKDTGITHRTASGPRHHRVKTLRQVRDPVGFRRIANPREVYALLTKARAALRSQSAAKPLE